jgi:hypothetical protein
MGRQMILEYTGEVNHEIKELLLEKARLSLNRVETNTGVKKKVNNILTECIENIQKYTLTEILPEEKAIALSPKIILASEEGCYFVECSNMVLSSQVQKLTVKIDQANALGKAGLQQWYEEIINDGRISDQGGAGLGIIDMAIKSGEKLKYKISRLNERISVYELTVTIGKI